jgi:hypothetical protein
MFEDLPQQGVELVLNSVGRMRLGTLCSRMILSVSLNWCLFLILVYSFCNI